MPDELPYYVFLSYSAKDNAVVRDVAERLRKDGLRATGGNGKGENIHHRPHSNMEKLTSSERTVVRAEHFLRKIQRRRREERVTPREAPAWY